MKKIYSLKGKCLLLIFAVLSVLTVVVTSLFVWKIEGIYSRVIVLKKYSTIIVTADTEYEWMHSNIDNISFDKVLVAEEDAWYTKYHVIARLCGAIDGKVSTNSLEAWAAAYAAGTRVIDADVSFTSDGVLVLRHGWSYNLEQIEGIDRSSTTNAAGTVYSTLTETIIMISEEFLLTPIYYQHFACNMIFMPLICQWIMLMMKARRY